MKTRSLCLTASVLSGVLACTPVTRGAAIFNVNFDATGPGNVETLNSAPIIVGSPARAPPYLHPTGLTAEGNSGVLVQNASSTTDFGTFGSDNFVVFTKDQDAATHKQNGTMNLTIPDADQPDSGTATFTFDYRRHEEVSENSAGNFAIYFFSSANIGNPSTGKVIGELTITLADNGLHVYRNSGSGPDAAGPTNITTIDPDADHTIKAVLTMNGAASTLDFYVDSIRLETDVPSTVSLGTGGKLRIAQFKIQNGDGGVVAVDNITLAVPEPAALGLLGLGGLTLLRRRN